MIGLLRTYLRPYRGPLVLVMVLLLIQAIGNLYLPDLNADIINNGVAKGDTDYILRTGALMLVVTLAPRRSRRSLAVYSGAKVAMGFGRDVRSAIFRKVESVLARSRSTSSAPASLITRNTNDVQQVQTVVFMALTVHDLGADPDHRRDHHGPPPGRAAVRPAGRRSCRSWALVIGLVMCRAIPLFRAMQVKLDRINQVMRETLAGVRVIRAFVRTEHEEARFDDANRDLFEHGAPGQPAVRDHDPGDDRDPQPVDRRGHVVRRDARRQRRRCRSAT